MRVALPVYNPTPPDPDVIARTRLKLEVGNEWFRNEGLTADLFPELADIACPTLVIGGELDPITPVADSEDIAAAIPQAEVRIFDGAGHGVFRDQPERRSPSFASSCCDEATARLSRPLSDPRAHDVPDQPLARRDAGGGRGADARVRAHVGRARDPSVGRGLVDDAAHRRRPDRTHRRGAAGDGVHAPERVRGRGDRPVVLPGGGRAEPDRLRARELPVGALRVPVAARARGRRRRTTCSARSTSARCSSLFSTSCSSPARSRTSRRSCGARTRRVRYVVLDAYQSAGTVPLDVTALGVDFAVGGSVKWLCGGPGAGWLYVRPGPDRAARAVGDGLAGARASVLVRARARVRRRDRALPHRDAERSRALRVDSRLRPDRGDRRRRGSGRTRCGRRSSSSRARRRGASRCARRARPSAAAER